VLFRGDDETGPVGSATTCKIINNFITVSNAAVVAEVVACAAALGMTCKFHDIVSSSGEQHVPADDAVRLRGDVSPLALRIATMTWLLRRPGAARGQAGQSARDRLVPADGGRGHRDRSRS
jgi:hypothetical protein